MELEVMRAFTSLKSDQEIGMPDVEQELARVKSIRRKPTASPLRKIAAILVAALMLTGLGYAAVRTSFFTKGWEAPTNWPPQPPIGGAEYNSASEDSPNFLPLKGDGEGQSESGLVLFKNARLDSVVTCIACHYKLRYRFTDESAKGIRMLLKWNKERPVDEVLELLNGFERIKVRCEEDELVIENKTEE